MKRRSALALCILVLTASPLSAFAEEQAPAGVASAAQTERDAPATADAASSIGWQAETALATTYVFRGRSQYGTRHDPSSQSTLAVTWKEAGPGALSLTVWNATALAGLQRQPGSALEIDVTPSYAWTLAKTVDVSVGYIGYFFPKALSGTPVDGAHELFGTAALSNAFIVPSVGVYADPVRLKGIYASAGLAKKLDFEKLSVTPQASFGFADYAGAPSRLNDVTAAVQAQWSFADAAYVSLRGSVSYMGGATSQLPTHDGSAYGRTVPAAVLALGMQR